MKKILSLIIALFLGCNSKQEYSKTGEQKNTSFSMTKTDFLKTTTLHRTKIRLLVLKHCPDEMANDDALQALKAAKIGLDEGLNIETLGNFHIDKNGMTENVYWSDPITNLSGLRDFVESQIKVNSSHNDTIIIYTIGHGSKGGTIMRLGQREGMMRTLSGLAAKHEQKILWWQLSCYANSKLPSINSLPEKEQRYFSMTASSPADEPSYSNTQGEQFKSVFYSMAKNRQSIDLDSDDQVSSFELSEFLTQNFGKKRGELVFALNDDYIIFGISGSNANKIPIFDRNGNQILVDPDYIPRPTINR